MKPVLIVDKDGSLQVLKTIRGRKKSLKALIEYVQENIADPSRQIMGICHGEDPDSLQYTKDLLLQVISPKELVESTIAAPSVHTPDEASSASCSSMRWMTNSMCEAAKNSSAAAHSWCHAEHFGV